jgi:hypothetical protein
LDAGNVFDRFPGAVKQIAAITIRPMFGRLFLCMTRKLDV